MAMQHFKGVFHLMKQALCHWQKARALRRQAQTPSGAAEKLDALPEPVQDYLEQIASFNPNGQAKIYPGSPFLMQRLMRHASRDRLRLFELHPTDSKALMSNIAQLEAGRTVTVSREDGFEALKKLLPPPPSPAAAAAGRRARARPRRCPAGRW